MNDRWSTFLVDHWSTFLVDEKELILLSNWSDTKPQRCWTTYDWQRRTFSDGCADLVVHRVEDYLLRSVSVCHSLSSDHLPLTCSLDISKPELRSVLRTTRNLRAIDREQFRQPDVTADQFNTEMQRFLDIHAPSTQRQVTRRHRSPSYSSIASELRSMKQERRRAERRWLSTGLTIHKEIISTIKHKISHLVSNAKSTFYSVKVSTSSAVKEVYKVTNNLLGKITYTPLPSAYPHSPTSTGLFWLLLSTRLPNPWFHWQPGCSFPLRTVLGSVISLVHPYVDLRESPMKPCWSSWNKCLLIHVF